VLISRRSERKMLRAAFRSSIPTSSWISPVLARSIPRRFTATRPSQRSYAGTSERLRITYAVKALTDLGTGAVLAVVTETGRGKGSGVPVNRSYAVLYTVIDGRIARITQFGTEQEALQAAGLRE
jgi:ketosteroid isomerase-like protein